MAKDMIEQISRLRVRTWDYYLERLTNIALSVYEWKNLPDTVDPRFLELSVYQNGMCVFFEDPVLGFLALPCMIGGKLNVYNVPTMRTAYAANGFKATLDETNSVVIFHNYTHDVPLWDIEMFATRLTNYQMTMDININAQKTPILVQCDDKQRLTMTNLMSQYQGDIPLIFGSKALDPRDIKTLSLEAPFIADKVNELRTQIWNDAMTYLGVSNINMVKKERMVVDEVTRNMGGVIASRYSPLEMRRQAAKQINDMFGLNVEVDYREDIELVQTDILNRDEGDEDG